MVTLRKKNVRRQHPSSNASTKRNSPIVMTSLLGVLHLQLLLRFLVATSSRNGGQVSSKFFVVCFSSSSLPTPLTPSRMSSSHQRTTTLKGSLFRYNIHHYQPQSHADSTTKTTVLLRGATSNSADVTATTSKTKTKRSTKKASKEKTSTANKKQPPSINNNAIHSQKKFSKQKGSNGGGGSAPSNNQMMMAARQYNSQLTKCNSVSELLSSFMEQTSTSTPSTSGDNNNKSSLSSSATHLAGAQKLNSVNFSTCLHRLARFAAKGSYSSTPSPNDNTNNNNNNQKNTDARKQVLSDPRFALLVCSMAEMASGVDASISVKMGSEIVNEWMEKCGTGGGEEEGMREADDVLNDIVGLSGGSNIDNNGGDSSGGGTLSMESRFATAEQIMNQLSTPQTKDSFSSRECSNVCWALAKLRVVPPSSAFALGRVVGDDDNESHSGSVGEGGGGKKNFLSSRQFVSLDEMALDVVSSTLQVRMQLFEEARKRKLGGSSNGAWIPELSRLAGKVMDLIAVKIIIEYGLRNDGGGDDDGTSSSSSSSSNTIFNPQEMASVLWAYAKSNRADDALFSTVAAELIRQTGYELERGGQGPRPQELSNTIWAFATAGIRGEQQIELVKFAADALDEGEGLFFGNAFKPQELANTGWALATLHSKRSEGTSTEAVEDDGIVRILRWIAKDIMQRVESFKPQEISNSVWAFSTVGFGYDASCGTNAHNDYVHVATDDPVGDKELVYDTLEVIAENALSRLHNFKAQELNNLAWGFTRLGHRTERTEKLLVGVAKELTERTWQFKPQDIGTTLWSLATAECFDQDAFMAGASRLNLKHIRSFKPQEMSNTVWALATAGFAPKHIRAFDTTLVPASQRPTAKMVMSDPVTECFAAVASEAMRRPQDFKDQELKDVLWAFSKIGVRHPALFKKVAHHLVAANGRGFGGFSSQGLGNTLWSFAKQAQLSLEVIDSLGDSVKLGSTGRLAVYETSCLDIGEKAIKTLFVRAAEGGIELGLDRFTNQDLSNTVWAYSTLGLLHSGFFKEAENQVLKRLKNLRPFKGQEIANILWSFATLNAQPDPALIDALSSYIASVCSGKKGVADEYSISKVFKRQELANVAWSCAVVGRYPEELMKILYAGIVGTANDPNRMKQIFNDDGLQQSSIMTLYYVQLAADIEASKLRLALPTGFPNGWGESEGHVRGNGDDLIEMSSSMLTLTISKLQRDVSNTFTEIGFENVLEHVIDTNEIKDEYGVSLPQTPQEFLSIDIANIGQKVGVEVDGPGHFVRLIDDTRKSSKKVLDGQFADKGENRVNGPTLLKHRLLTHLGWNIIHLPYWEYQSLGGDREKERKYCQSLL
jgi:hypothetical protein